MRDNRSTAGTEGASTGSSCCRRLFDIVELRVRRSPSRVWHDPARTEGYYGSGSDQRRSTGGIRRNQRSDRFLDTLKE